MKHLLHVLVRDERRRASNISQAMPCLAVVWRTHDELELSYLDTEKSAEPGNNLVSKVIGSKSVAK